MFVVLFLFDFFLLHLMQAAIVHFFDDLVFSLLVKCFLEISARWKQWRYYRFFFLKFVKYILGEQQLV